jgi:hypothetical protein
MCATDDATMTDAGEHEMQVQIVGEAPDTGEHAATIADALRAHNARMYRIWGSVMLVCSPRHAVHYSCKHTRCGSKIPHRFGGAWQARVHEKEFAKDPPNYLCLKDNKHFKHVRDVLPES